MRGNGLEYKFQFRDFLPGTGISHYLNRNLREINSRDYDAQFSRKKYGQKIMILGITQCVYAAIFPVLAFEAGKNLLRLLS